VLVLNVARGGIVDEAALADGLASGQVGGAAIDVFETEPPTGSPLLDAPNTILTPHLGASTVEAQVAVAVEVAAGVLDVLDGRPARSAVNAPIVSAEAAGAIAPFLPLAETLGRFFAQFARTAPKTLTFEVAGTPAETDSAPLTAAMLRGLLQATTEERVNLVNAGLLAKARGITVVERRTPQAGAYAALVTVSGEAGGRRMTVAGTINAGEERLVQLNDYRLDMEPTDVMLITRHNDRPGMIGRVGRILGDADVNISAMHVARSAPRQDALMILALDDDVPAGVLESIRTHEALADLWLIHLGEGDRTHDH
jgi:D-3-phosphoglycerate dehydrogenase